MISELVYMSSPTVFLRRKYKKKQSLRWLNADYSLEKFHGSNECVETKIKERNPFLGNQKKKKLTFDTQRQNIKHVIETTEIAKVRRIFF